jgi:hypothetical protein
MYWIGLSLDYHGWRIYLDMLAAYLSMGYLSNGVGGHAWRIEQMWNTHYYNDGYNLLFVSIKLTIFIIGIFIPIFISMYVTDESN